MITDKVYKMCRCRLLVDISGAIKKNPNRSRIDDQMLGKLNLKKSRVVKCLENKEDMGAKLLSTRSPRGGGSSWHVSSSKVES